MSSTWTLVRATTQSARREEQGAWRGYALQFALWTQWPQADLAYPGSQQRLALQHLHATLDALRDRPLNDCVADASDGGLVHWLAQRWRQQGLPPLARLALASTPMSGADCDAQGRVTLWRRYRLHCAHFLPHVPLGHKCGRLHGHDFEVVLQLGASAALPSAEAIDALWAPLQQRLNYRCLNDIDGLDNPTSEVLSRWLWQHLSPALADLRGVAVLETASCAAHYDGRCHRIWKEFSFDSATRLTQAPDSADESRVHGHSYRLRLVLNAPLDAELGWAMDFGDVKAVFSPLYQALDHQPLFERSDMRLGDLGSIAEAILRDAQTVLPTLERVDLADADGLGCEVAVGAHVSSLPL